MYTVGRGSLKFTAYSFDHEFARYILEKVWRGNQVFLLADRVQLTDGKACKSCRQSLKDLDHRGCHIRQRGAREPVTAGFQLFHQKCWLFGRAVLVCGSMNATSSSMNNGEECGVITRSASVVREYNDYCDELWGSATKLPQVLQMSANSGDGGVEH